LPTAQILLWGIEYCHGTEYARTKCMVCHRDIKPDNILIDADGHLKITDFGLVGAIESVLNEDGIAVLPMPANKLGLTMLRLGKGARCGTLGYIAPEVFNGAGADVRSDVYSFGVVLYQMAIGQVRPPLYKNREEQFGRKIYALWKVRYGR
jgi:serine/threonine protein kinase